MPESFIFAIVLVGLALILFILSPATAHASYWSEDQRKTVTVGWRVPLWTATTFLLLAGLFTVNASFNTIGVRHIGIETSFHKPTGAVHKAGVAWVDPRHKVEEWDANYELWDHRHDNKDDKHKDGKGMLVKIAGNQDAWVPVSVEYAPNPDNAPQDFTDYARNRDNWIQRRVYPTLDNIVSNLFRTHDPLAKANIDSVTGQVNPPDMTPYKNQLNTELQNAGVEFKIRNLYVGTIVYNDKTTEALQTYANLVLENRNLGQQKINQDLKNGITDKQAKVDKQTYCLQISEKNGTNPGLCLLGSGSSVIVNSEPATK